MVIQGGQRAVAEAQEPGVQLLLVALDALTLQVHLGLGCNDGLDVIRLGQGVHVHIIVHHEQPVLQVGAGELVRLDLLDAAHVHGIAQHSVQHQSDAALTLAALADDEHHPLGLGGRDQAVAHVLLQGGDIVRLQQLRKEGQPALGLAAAGL